MMLDEALAQPVSALPQDPPLKQTACELILEDHSYHDVQALLFDASIYFAIKNTQQEVFLRVNFTFDLVFQLLRKGQNQQTVRVHGEPFGFKFERFNRSLTFKLNTDKDEIMAWRQYLENKLNQKGFHQLFKPIKKIGKGNFASVYLVIRHEDGKKYAVKAFSKEATFGEQNGKEALINEIEVMRKFSQKNLMKLYGVFESQNSVYVTIQLLEGGQLCDKIKSRHKFCSLEIKMIMKGILEGLQEMHALNIMHRDLKPENILLRKEGDYDCVIADFGLSQSCLNQPYLFVRCGTPGYVAPEVVNLKDLKAKYHPICDLFSVGVIFHILALRKPPFPGKEYNQVLAQNRACNLTFQEPEYMNLPETWLDLMKRMLEKDPSKRITATQALNHQFFAKDNMFAQFNKQRTQRQSHGPKQQMMQECQSPLLMTKNNARKNPQLLRDDSCLKFKMKQNILTGRTDHTETVDEIDSPGIRQRPMRNGGVQSRFKRMAK